MKKKKQRVKKGSTGNDFFIWLPWVSWNESIEDPPLWPAVKCGSFPSTKEKRLMFMTSVSGALRRGMTSLFLNNPIELKKNSAVLLCITCTCGRKLAYAVWEKYHRVCVRTSVTNAKEVKSASQASPLLRSKEEASQRMDKHIQRAWLSGVTSTSCLTFQQKYCFFVFNSLSH